jgi:hypothetical protein
MHYTDTLRLALHNTFRYGQGTRDMSGPTGYTTEDFIRKVAWRLGRYLANNREKDPPPVLSEPDRAFRRNFANVDMKAIQELFEKFDTDGAGKLDFKQFTKVLVKMGVAPQKEMSDKTPDI